MRTTNACAKDKDASGAARDWPFADVTLGGDGMPATIPGAEPRFVVRARTPGDALELARHASADDARAAGTWLASDLLADPGPYADRRPTAIFAVTDQLALGALDGAASSGVRVPDELSVVGFDNVGAAASATPPLTTVSQELFEQGQATAKIVLDEIAGRRARARAVEVKLIVRASTAPAR